MKTQFKFTRLFYYLMRGSVRILTFPVRPLKEGRFKNQIRSFVLNFQHSLPTELVVNKGDIVVQIGTPWPKTMVRFLRAVGPKGHLIIAEAMPENQQRLSDYIDSNRIKNVTLIRGAIANETKSGTLQISPYRGDHKISVNGVNMDNDLKPGNETYQKIPVNFYKLDDILPKCGFHKFDYLSITVNGAEAEVLRGCKNILKSCNPNTRLYAKGHALDANGNPIHLQSKNLVSKLGFKTKITKGEPSSTINKNWLWRAGDLYAWKI